ncbi:MAG TPA: hypothetical protein VN228_16710 [Pyrinomonadaceae bacterium]|nr:hypothetical protein [Pyrinomonadaceae bacterium]
MSEQIHADKAEEQVSSDSGLLLSAEPLGGGRLSALGDDSSDADKSDRGDSDGGLLSDADGSDAGRLTDADDSDGGGLTDADDSDTGDLTDADGSDEGDADGTDGGDSIESESGLGGENPLGLNRQRPIGDEAVDNRDDPV